MVGAALAGEETTMATTYTVRPLGCTSWQDGIETIDEALASARDAREQGLHSVVIVDDVTGEIVPETEQE